MKFLPILLSLCIACGAEKIFYLTVDNFNNWPVPKMVVFNDETSLFEVITNPFEILSKALHPEEGDVVVKLSQEEFDLIMEKTEKYNHYSSQNYAITFPGTLWCGPGTMAKSYDELGRQIETDRCCRDHDHCDSMHSGETKNNLTNPSPFTRLECSCDEAFSTCLGNAKKPVANIVAEFYFNLVQNLCYKLEHPIITCAKMPKRGNCNEYEVDETKPKIWQFLLPKRYIST